MPKPTLVKRAEYFYHIDQLRYKYTRQGRFEHSFEHYNAMEMDDVAQDFNDHGFGADAILHFDETLPLWLTLFYQAIKKLENQCRYKRNRLKAKRKLRVIKSVMNHLTISAAAEKTRLSRAHFYSVLKKLQVDFAQCFQAYHEYLAIRECLHLSQNTDYGSGEG